MDTIQQCEVDKYKHNFIDGINVLDNVKKPNSLFKLCLDFVGANIVYVDTFVGLPSDIAEKIFQIAIKINILNPVTKQVGLVLNKLCEAYTTDFLSSIRCNDEYFIAVYEDMFPYIMTYLKEMDISNCMIGNNSEILRVFCKMPYLRVLSLSNNSLTDEGFRNIFMPYRVMRRGFESLIMIDVSLNEISKSTMCCIAKLPNIRKICFTTPSDISAYNSIFSESSFYICSKNDRNEFTSIGIQGWGARLITSWHLCLREKYLKSKIVYSETENDDFQKCRKFYGLNKKILQHQIGNKFFGSLPHKDSIRKKKILSIKYITVIKSKQNSDDNNVITSGFGKSKSINRISMKCLKSPLQYEKKRKLNDDQDHDLLEAELISIYKTS